MGGKDVKKLSRSLVRPKKILLVSPHMKLVHSVFSLKSAYFRLRLR